MNNRTSESQSEAETTFYETLRTKASIRRTCQLFADILLALIDLRIAQQTEAMLLFEDTLLSLNELPIDDREKMDIILLENNGLFLLHRIVQRFQNNFLYTTLFFLWKLPDITAQEKFKIFTQKNACGGTLIALASEIGNNDGLMILFSFLNDLKIPDESKFNAIMSPTKDGATAAYLATQNKQSLSILLMLNFVEKLNLPQRTQQIKILNSSRPDQASLFYVAADHGHLNIFQIFWRFLDNFNLTLEDKIRIAQQPTTTGVAPCFLTFHNGHGSLFDFQLELINKSRLSMSEKFNIFFPLNQDNSNIFHDAIKFGQLYLVKQSLLAAAALIPNPEDPRFPFVLKAQSRHGSAVWLAIKNGRLKIFEAFVKFGFSLSAVIFTTLKRSRNNSDWHRLVNTAKKFSLDIAKKSILKPHCAKVLAHSNITASDDLLPAKEFWTALPLAVLFGQLELVRYITRQDPNCIERSRGGGVDPIEIAVALKHTEITDELMKAKPGLLFSSASALGQNLETKDIKDNVETKSDIPSATTAITQAVTFKPENSSYRQRSKPKSVLSFCDVM